MFRLRLKALRESKGLSQAAFAKEFGVAQGTIGNWESGSRMPSAATIAKIAEHFGVPVGYLLEEDEEKEERPAASGAFDEEDIKVFLMYARSDPSVKAMIKAALMAADEAKEQNEAITKEARNTVVKVAEDVIEMLKGLKGWE